MKNNWLYSLYIFLVVFVLSLLLYSPLLKGLMTSFEYKSYDLMQNVVINPKETNSQIVILAIDDTSIELMEELYGKWPWDRKAYSHAIEMLDKYGAKQIILDLMFVGKSQSQASDDALVKSYLNNDKVSLGINLDYRSTVREMPEVLAVKVKDDSNILFPVYRGFRPILRELMSKPRVGIVNFQRDFDGIARRVPTLFKLDEKYYPYLGLKAMLNHVGADKFEVNKDNELIFKNSKLKLSKNGSLILNWYNERFDTVPFWKLNKAKNKFKDKIVIVGITASSLYDIKSTPLNRNTPGVEILATMINNFIDDNFVYHLPFWLTFSVAVLLSIFVGLATINWTATVASLSLCFAVIFSYSLTAVLLLKYWNLWIDVIFVIFAILFSFAGAYILKYKNKSKDFEHTYKLATTDGLTGLYNHRFFQEQMLMFLENAKRYDSKFSLLLIDVDFFKKFNDTYGHQAGDAVLKKVAELLKSSVRTTDMVARYGGEEMAIILPNTDYDKAMLTAQKICDKIATTPFFLNSKTSRSVTVSIGVSTYPDNVQSAEEMIEYADKALYVAKNNGRNQVGKVVD